MGEFPNMDGVEQRVIDSPKLKACLEYPCKELSLLLHTDYKLTHLFGNEIGDFLHLFRSQGNIKNCFF